MNCAQHCSLAKGCPCVEHTTSPSKRGVGALSHDYSIYGMWELCEEIKEMMYFVFCSGRIESYVYVGMSDIDVFLKYMYK